MNYTITIEQDPDCEDPSSWDLGWTPYSFSRKHIHSNYVSPNQFFILKYHQDVVPKNIGITRKLEVGTAFILSYYEHGGCSWSLQGEGAQCPWDSVDVAGILLWEHSPKDLPKGVVERTKWARSFLNSYNLWLNGECYWFKVEQEDKELDSCGGLLGTTWLVEFLKDACPYLFDEENEIEYKGLAKEILT